MKKLFVSLFLSMCLFLSIFMFSDLKGEAAAENGNIVVVIDPGHGGEGEQNLGAQYNGFSEKELTMQVAVAMKTELEKYENVTVYLTRTTDTFISLENRAAYAKSVNADFLYSIHFNASVDHEFYGSEIWTSAFNSYYQKGYDFGQIELAELSGLSIYPKGVKTKIGKTGKDYYGIIRAGVARDIPTVIIEHAYLDHGYDVQLLSQAGIMESLGIADATAVAKYFNLKSSVLGNDFTDYSYSKVASPSATVYQDATEPDSCRIKLITFDKNSRNALVEMFTKDSQSPVIYFSYSYNGGQTFSVLQMWDRTKNAQSFNVYIPEGISTADIVCRAYNNYELYTMSNEVTFEIR